MAGPKSDDRARRLRTRDRQHAEKLEGQQCHIVWQHCVDRLGRLREEYGHGAHARIKHRHCTALGGEMQAFSAAAGIWVWRLGNYLVPSGAYYRLPLARP